MAHILVVDDDEMVGDALADLLIEEGHSVSQAANGRQALEALQDILPDLVITDFRMPVMDGPALALAIKADERFRWMPVIIVSSYYLTEAELAVLGVRGLVLKPWATVKLLQVIDRLLDNPLLPKERQ